MAGGRSAASVRSSSRPNKFGWMASRSYWPMKIADWNFVAEAVKTLAQKRAHRSAKPASPVAPNGPAKEFLRRVAGPGAPAIASRDEPVFGRGIVHGGALTGRRVRATLRADLTSIGRLPLIGLHMPHPLVRGREAAGRVGRLWGRICASSQPRGSEATAARSPGRAP